MFFFLFFCFCGFLWILLLILLLFLVVYLVLSILLYGQTIWRIRCRHKFHLQQEDIAGFSTTSLFHSLPLGTKFAHWRHTLGRASEVCAQEFADHFGTCTGQFGQLSVHIVGSAIYSVLCRVWRWWFVVFWPVCTRYMRSYLFFRSMCLCSFYWSAPLLPSMKLCGEMGSSSFQLGQAIGCLISCNT